LIEVGFAQFAEYGFDAVTVDAICEAARVAKGTFYFHFPTKQALLVAAFYRGGDDVIQHAEALAESDTPFVEAVLALGGRIARNTSTVPKPLVRRATVETLAAIDAAPDDTERHHRRDALLLLVDAAARRGEVSTDFQPAEIAMALNWTIVQSILVWTATADRAASLETITRRRLTMTLVGVAAGR
jgi:AcrR family transcriptional regulator